MSSGSVLFAIRLNLLGSFCTACLFNYFQVKTTLFYVAKSLGLLGILSLSFRIILVSINLILSRQ